MHRLDRSICILLGALCLTGASVYCRWGLKNDHTAFFVYVATSATLYATSLISISFPAKENVSFQVKLEKVKRREGSGLRHFQHWPLELATLSTRVTGLLGGLYTFALSLLTPFEDPIADADNTPWISL